MELVRTNNIECSDAGAAIKPSSLTLHFEMLLLCARIGYSPHGFKNVSLST